jgi:hypothetical protein
MIMELEAYEHLDALHAETMAAWQAAEESLAACQASGRPADVERHLADRRRAYRLSNEYHLEADLVMFIHYERREALSGS